VTITGRPGALLALVVLGVALVAVVVVTTPWDTLPGRSAPRTAVDASRDFTEEEIAHEVDFHDQVRPPAYAGLIVSTLVVLLLGLTPLGARLVGAVARPLGGGWAAQAAVGVLAILVVQKLVALPLDARAEVVLRRFGLSTQSWSSWAVDQLKSLAVSSVVSAVAALILYALIRKAPGSWWVWAGLAGAALTVALSFVYPLVFEPMFNTFTPLPAGELRDSLLELAERDGIEVDDVLVADASRRTTALNAYVSGIGSTRRIVVYDTLVEKASPDEVRLVVAHELGHVAEHDVRDGTLIGALGVALAMAALALALSSAWVRERAGLDGVDDARGVALVAALAAVAALLAAPVGNLVSRRVEARADVHALDLSRDVTTFVAGERTLAVTNLSDLEPHPLQTLMFATHPTAPDRIALARDWAVREGVAVPGGLDGNAPR
jgi:STE24 endopeptidase